MILATSAGKAEKLRKNFDETKNKYDWSKAYWEDDAKVLVNSAAYHSGYVDPHGGHFHPVKYLIGIAGAARKLGAQIFEHSAVINITKGKINTVTTKEAVIRAKYLVVAANVYLQDLIPELSKRIMPAGTWMVASEELDKGVARRLIPSGAAVFDSNNVLDYFRFTRDNRLIFGGEVSYSSLFPKDLKKNLRKNISKVFPELSDIKLEFAWGGHVDITLHRNPDFGRLGNNIYYLQGFSGQGVALTNIAGKLVAQCIVTGEDKLDVFAKLPKVTFPGFGDYSRTGLLMIGMLYYRLLDIIG
jgi:gamma-glutamylputrescine oxidase